MRDILFITNNSSAHFCAKSQNYLNFDLTIRQSNLNQDALSSSNYRSLIFNAFTIECFFKLTDPDLIKRSAFIFFVDFWERLNRDDKEKLRHHPVFLIYDEFHPDLYKSTAVKKFFVVTKKNRDLVENFDDSLAQNFSLFFPLNLSESSADFLSIADCIDLMDKKSKFTFELPAAYDIIDSRNHLHLSWNWFERGPTRFKDIKISIIIPTYNRSHLIGKVLEFIKNQTLDDPFYEVIIIDDGSSIEEANLTQARLEHFKFKNLIYRHLEREIKIEDSKVVNRAGPARNLGASLSSGELLLFLDSDIILAANYLEKLLNLHLENDVCLPGRIYLSQHATREICTSNFDQYSDDSIEVDWTQHLHDVFDTHDWFKMSPPWKLFMTYALSVKRNLFFESGGFRTNFISYGYEDLDWGYRVCKLSDRFKISALPSYHLYHFDDKSSEYSCDKFSRSSQLAFTSRVFFFQNFPKNAKYLINMAVHKTAEPVEKN